MTSKENEFHNSDSEKIAQDSQSKDLTKFIHQSKEHIRFFKEPKEQQKTPRSQVVDNLYPSNYERKGVKLNSTPGSNLTDEVIADRSTVKHSQRLTVNESSLLASRAANQTTVDSPKKLTNQENSGSNLSTRLHKKSEDNKFHSRLREEQVKSVEKQSNQTDNIYGVDGSRKYVKSGLETR